MGEHKLFVGSLPPDITKEEIETVFKTYGELADVHVISGDRNRSATGQSCAFVMYKSRESGDTAIQVLNNVYKIREDAPNAIQVNWARSSKGKDGGKGGGWSNGGKGDHGGCYGGCGGYGYGGGCGCGGGCAGGYGCGCGGCGGGGGCSGCGGCGCGGYGPGGYGGGGSYGSGKGASGDWDSWSKGGGGPAGTRLFVVAVQRRLPRLLRFNLNQAFVIDLVLCLSFHASSFSRWLALQRGDAFYVPSEAELPQMPGSRAILLLFGVCLLYCVSRTACGAFPDGIPYISAQAKKSMGSSRTQLPLKRSGTGRS